MGLFDNINTVLESDVFDEWMGSPLTYMGAGLASQGNLGAGFLTGAQGYRRDREQRSLADYRNAQIEAQQQAIAQRRAQAQAAQEQQALRQQWMQQNYPNLVNAPEALQNEVFKSQFKKPDQTSAMQNLIAAGLQPGTPEFQKAMLEYMMKPPISLGTPETGGLDFKNEAALRGEYLKATKDYWPVRDAFERVQASVEDPSAAGDLALIFNYMKMLDPGSTVREGEFANAENAGGVGPRIRAQWNKLKSGQRLSEEQRADFADRARRLFEKQHNKFLESNQYYTGLAGQYAFDPARIIREMPELEVAPPAETQQREPDETRVIDGVTYYRFGNQWMQQ